MLFPTQDRAAYPQPWIFSHLICPQHHVTLILNTHRLVCPKDHSYDVVHGVPILLDRRFQPEIPRPHLPLTELWKKGRHLESEVDPFVQQAVGATNGIMYRQLIGHLREYPIPELSLPTTGGVFLDLGCNWGRWCVAAARQGYTVIGIDPNPEAVFAAQRVALRLGLTACFVVADARSLPFEAGIFDIVFSYSVLQHFSKSDAKIAIAETARVLKPNGICKIQMANALGIRSLYHQIRRALSPRGPFHVRYWTPWKLKRTFEALVGPSSIIVDGFLCLNSQVSEIRFLPPLFRVVVYISIILRNFSRHWPLLIPFADSLYISSRKLHDNQTIPAAPNYVRLYITPRKRMK